MEPFFPLYLDKGSSGPAVIVLQMLLKATGTPKSEEVVCDGDYGDCTSASVKKLQFRLGFQTENCDGNFGPATRAEFIRVYGIDVNAISFEQMQGPTTSITPD